MDISLELKGLPCLNKVNLLTYLLRQNSSLPHPIKIHLCKILCPELSKTGRDSGSKPKFIF